MGIALGVIIANAIIIGSLVFICVKRGRQVPIPGFSRRREKTADAQVETGVTTTPTKAVRPRHIPIVIRVEETEPAATSAAPTGELDAERGPYELEGSTSWYRKSLLAVNLAVKSAGKSIRSARTSRMEEQRRSFDADTETVYTRSLRTRMSTASSEPPLPTPSDYVGRDRRFTFGARADTPVAEGPSSPSRSSQGSQFSARPTTKSLTLPRRDS